MFNAYPGEAAVMAVCAVLVLGGIALSLWFTRDLGVTDDNEMHEAMLASTDGYEACHNGESSESCELEPGTYFYDCWHDGYNSAKHEIETEGDFRNERT